ncbi:MAG: hypothetical protein LAO03_02165 [Acidobacteriia bacterium]|nr:hypothetical protein [Terriglobia bacterium]
MKLSSMLLGACLALVVAAVLMVVLGVNFQMPLPASSAELYDPATETLISGVVTDTRDFICPVSEQEIGSHLLLQTANGVVQVHLAPARVMRGRKITFARDDSITVVGSRVQRLGKNDLIAREITRGNETIVFRNPQGKLMLTQY